MKSWTIYKITNPNGRIYIGKTSSFKKRVQCYKKSDCKKQKMIYGSLIKYGFESHSIEVIDEFTSDDSFASEKEIFWIRSFMSNTIKWPEMNGMNLTDGGQGTTGWRASAEHKAKLSAYHKANPSMGMLGKRLSEETKKKLSEYNKLHKPIGLSGKKLSPEHIAKIIATKKLKYPKGTIKRSPASDETKMKQSLAKKGRTAWNKGIPLSEKQRQFLRKINTGRPSWNKGKKFEGTEAERKIKFGAHNIGHVRNRGRKQNSDIIANRIKKVSKPILQYELNGNFIKEYPSTKVASQEIGMPYSSIMNILRAVTKNSQSFVFKYKNL